MGNYPENRMAAAAHPGRHANTHKWFFLKRLFPSRSISTRIAYRQQRLITVHVHLFSPDPHLRELCQDFVGNFGEGTFSASDAEPSTPLPPADVYVFDYPPHIISDACKDSDFRKNVIVI